MDKERFMVSTAKLICDSHEEGFKEGAQAERLRIASELNYIMSKEQFKGSRGYSDGAVEAYEAALKYLKTLKEAKDGNINRE